MKILVLCLVSVLFVSEAFTTRVNLKDFFVQKSGETENKDVEGLDNSIAVQSISENISTEDLEPMKREKKSYYSPPPCNGCAYNGNPYDQRPPMGYSDYRPIHGSNHYNLPPKPLYHVPAPAYTPPTYHAPSHQQPAYNSYNHNRYPAPAYPSPSFYPHPHQPSHSIPSSKLLIGCHPHASPVPDVGYSPHFFYSPPLYAQPQPHTSVAYRTHPEDSSVSASKHPDFDDNETMPEKVSLLENTPANSQPATGNSAKTTAKNSKNETVQTVNNEKAVEQQHQSLLKFAQSMSQLDKKSPATDGKQSKEPLTGKKIDKRNYQHSNF